MNLLLLPLYAISVYEISGILWAELLRISWAVNNFLWMLGI